MIAQLVILAEAVQPASPRIVHMEWSDFLRVYWSGGLTIQAGPVLVLLLLTLGGCLGVYLYRRQKVCPTRYDVVEANLQIANLGKVTVRPSHDDAQIAYRAWVELVTRKAALPFDPNHDSINEVYDSWYEMFGRLRELIKTIPAHRLRRDADTRELVRTLIKVLNDGLRPHLTQWQARFRRWYSLEVEMEEAKAEAPQEIQKRFPQYAELLADLQAVNHGMVQYASWLSRITQGDPK